MTGIEGHDNRQRTFSHDAAGNVISHRISRDELVWVPDPSCSAVPPPANCGGSFQNQIVDVQQTDFEYDELNRLRKAIDVLNQSSSRSNRFEYNLNDQIKKSFDGLNNDAVFYYNAHNDLRQVNARDGGVSKLTYDAQGYVRGIKDPVDTWTWHVKDGFGQIVQRLSQAGGNWSYGYDQAGNLTRITDARGVITILTYDALNRLKTSKADTEPTTVYTYDTNRKGYLYQVVDKAGTHTYTRNHAGEITSKVDNVLGVSMMTSFTYDVVGRVDVMTYPSGLNAQYTYNQFGDTERIRVWGPNLSTRDVVHNVLFYPWGPLNKVYYGNGEIRSEFRNLSYDLFNLISGNHLARSYQYDAKGKY